MESSGVVVDTSIFIDYLRAREKKNTDLYKIPESLVYNLSVLTTNISHFQRIKGLQIENG